MVRLRQYIHYSASPLAFDHMFRVHVNNGFALSKTLGLDYLEIPQFRGVIPLNLHTVFSPSLVIILYA